MSRALGQSCGSISARSCRTYGMPVHISDQLPRFAGSLDIVVAISERADHDGLSQSIVTAARRGCHVVVACAPHGHIAADAEDVAAIVVPALPLVQGLSPARVFAVVTAVLRCLDHTVRAAGDISAELNVSADHADRELQECSPKRDQLVNPARQLALLSGRVIHSGRGLVAASLADTMSALWTAFGRASASMEAQELEVALPRLEPKEQNIFYDPEFDAPPSSNSELPLHTVLWLSAETVTWARSQVSEDTTHERDGVIRMLARGYAATAFFGATDA